MKKVVILPGRFQPMLRHHVEVYAHLQAQFPDSDVYIATTDKVDGERSPFNFKEKQQIIESLGIAPDKVLQVRRPYFKDDYIPYFDESDTIIVFAVGEKDVDRFPFDNVDPKSGIDMGKKGKHVPKYFQKINTYNTDPRPMSERGYITMSPTIGSEGDAASASAFRSSIVAAPDVEAAKELVEKQYGQYSEKIFNLIYQKIKGTIEMKENQNASTLVNLMDAFKQQLETDAEIDESRGGNAEISVPAVYVYGYPDEMGDDFDEDRMVTLDVDYSADLIPDRFDEPGGWDINIIKVNNGRQDIPLTSELEDYLINKIADESVNEESNAYQGECSHCEGAGCESCDYTGKEELPETMEETKVNKMNKDIARMRHLAGLTESPVEFLAANQGNAAAQARTKARAAAKKDNPDGLTSKERRDSDKRAGDKLASDPTTAMFGDTMASHTNGGMNPGTDPQGGTIANFFPQDVDINDPQVKKENFLKAIQKAPSILFGEINARLLGRDDNSLAVSDRLSDIVREFENGATINTISPDDKAFALAVAVNAMKNMELKRRDRNEVEPEGLDDSGDPSMGSDPWNEFGDDNVGDDSYDDSYNDSEFEEGAYDSERENEFYVPDDEECSQCHGCGIMATGKDYDGSDMDFECTKCNGTGYADGRHREGNSGDYYGDGVNEDAGDLVNRITSQLKNLGVTDINTGLDIIDALESSGDFGYDQNSLLSGLVSEFESLSDDEREAVINSVRSGVMQGNDDDYMESFNLMKQMAGI